MKFLDQRGNLLITISFLLIISAAVGAFVLNNKRVSEAVRGLDTLQVQNVLKGDIEKNLVKILKNSSIPHCSNTIKNAFRDKFVKLSLDNGNPVTEEFNSNSANAFTNPYVRCLITPNKFDPNLTLPGLNIKFFKLEMRKANTLNLSNIFSDVFATVIVGIKPESGGVANFTYNLKFRVYPKGLNDYALVVSNYNGNRKLFDSNNKMKVTVYGKTLVASNSTLSNVKLKDFTDTEKASVKYLNLVEIEGQKFSVDNDYAELLNNGELNITNVFSSGVMFQNLSTRIHKPWVTNPGAFNDTYWYQFIKTAYILPKLNGALRATVRSGSNYLKYGEGAPSGVTVDPNDTASIFAAINPSEGKKTVASTCGEGNISSGIFSNFVYNNLNEDLTIDLSNNTNSDFPPYFCGVVAAKTIKVKLNTSSDPNFNKNYLIGKFIVKNKIIIEGALNKELIIIDSSRADASQLVYPLPDADQSIDTIGQQLYVQKFYQTQNFFLPFFDKNLALPGEDHFKARSLKEFFTVIPSLCESTTNPLTDPQARCRQGSITSPELIDVIALKDNFYYEVDVVE